MIAFDIDSVIVDFESMLIDWFERLGYEWRDRSKFDIETMPKIRHDYLMEIFDMIYENSDNAKYMPCALDVLQAVYLQTNQPLRFITSRPMHTAGDTHRVIRNLVDDMPFQIAFADNGRNKLLFMDGITHFVEDRRKTALEVAASGRIVYLMDKPWNQEMQPDRRIIRIPSLVHLLNYMEYLPKAA